MVKWIVVCLMVVALVGTADARPRVFRTRTKVSVRHYEGGPAQVAQAKAAQCAANCRMAHLGGGYGGANAEGVGCGVSAAAALANCCFTGTRRVAASAVVRGKNGMYYAVKLFW